jgi:NhaP-type Na+/H+ or K+/H+ antiporter
MAQPRLPGDALLHPAFLAAVGVLLFNDHWLKWHHPSALTGKLSDFAGLAFFPVLLWSGWELSLAAARRFRGPSWRAALASVIATAVVFSLVKTTDAGAELYRHLWAAMQWPARAALALSRGALPAPPGAVHLVRDPTDLIALPALALPLWIARRRARPPQQLSSSP